MVFSFLDVALALKLAFALFARMRGDAVNHLGTSTLEHVGATVPFGEMATWRGAR